jgi:hypothetical protein
MNNYSSSNPGGPPAGGGGGGGGGSKPPKKGKAEKPVDHTKRYENIEAVINKTTTALERYAKAEDHAFGLTKIALMKKESKEIERLGENYQSLYKEAQKYYEEDKKKAKTLDADSIAALSKAGIKTKVPQLIYLDNGDVANME